MGPITCAVRRKWPVCHYSEGDYEKIFQGVMLPRIHCLPYVLRIITLLSSWRRFLRPCFELLCTKMLSETATTSRLLWLGPTIATCSSSAVGFLVVDAATWNLLISLGLPAPFRQFWLHFKKNLSSIRLNQENKKLSNNTLLRSVPFPKLTEKFCWGCNKWQFQLSMGRACTVTCRRTRCLRVTQPF